MASRRGGASAPTVCKQKLRNCMTSGVRAGGTTPSLLGKKCFTEFNTCHHGKGRRKKTVKKTVKKASKRSRR